MGVIYELGAGKAHILAEQDDREAAPYEIAAGVLWAYSRSCPTTESVNEDSVLLYSHHDNACVFAVADGMGGSRAAHHASLRALDALGAQLEGAGGDESSLRTAILDGIERANAAVMDMGVGAATTLSVVEIRDSSMRCYQVGDSLVLALGNRGSKRFQSKCHSPVGYGVESGLLDEQEAMHHEERHLVSNYVGTQEMQIEISSFVKLKQRDTVLAASDGLSDNVSIEELLELSRMGGLDEVSSSLTALANQRMGGEDPQIAGKPDDCSFVLFRFRS